MPVEEEIERNRLLGRLYKPYKYGYKKLGRQFKLHWTTVKEIVDREKVREKARGR